MSLPNDIKILISIEKNYNVVSLFQHDESSAWIYIKDFLTLSMYDKSIRLGAGNKRDIVSWNGLKQIVKSLKYYFGYKKAKEKKALFLGASTGLFVHNDKVWDSYFPYYDVNSENSIYMFNCGNLRDLEKFHHYQEKHQIVIENYLIVILKKIFSKIVYKRLPSKKREEIYAFNHYLKTKKIVISDKLLLMKYSEFIAGYTLYRKLFKALKIDKAYIVSAPTKSDMVGALKSLDIETVDIQHGVIGKLHRGYNFHLEPNRSLPTVDRVDVYNQFWKDEVVKAGYFKKDQVKVVGRLKYDIVKSNIEALNFKYIIFTGQGAYLEQITDFFINADKVLKEKNIKMFYKLHPRELESEKEYFKNRIRDLEMSYVYEDNYTTEALIKHSFAHISVFSSCHFDAVYYQDKSYILDIMKENIMHYYAESFSDKFITITKIEEVV